MSKKLELEFDDDVYKAIQIVFIIGSEEKDFNESSFKKWCVSSLALISVQYLTIMENARNANNAKKN